MNLNEFVQKFELVTQEVGKMITGQRDIIKYVLTAMLAGGNVLLEGMPGLGKTKLIKSIGAACGAGFSRIQFTPDLMPSDITGTDIFTPEKGFKFRYGPVFSNIVLADEINRATPKTQSALLEAMQEKTVTAGKMTYNLPSPFFVLATQNPIENEGTYPLPEAQLDRFMFKLKSMFPTLDELTKIIEMTTGEKINSLNAVCSPEAIIDMQNTAAAVPVSISVCEYASRLIYAAHPEYSKIEKVKKYVKFGASPRGGQALISGAKVLAASQGRSNVSFDDIKELLYIALRHRIIMNFEAFADGIEPEDIIKEIAENVKQ